MYLKNDMKAKFVFLNDLEAAVGFTSTLMTQEYEGSTTIVPEVSFFDYFKVESIFLRTPSHHQIMSPLTRLHHFSSAKLFSNPTLRDLEIYLQRGSAAVYPHCAMIKLHYSIADALDECLSKLENRITTRPRVKGLMKPTSPQNDDIGSSTLSSTYPLIGETTKGSNEWEPQSSDTSMSEEDEYERNWVYDISPRR
jgi:hypothetical protein